MPKKGGIGTGGLSLMTCSGCVCVLLIVCKIWCFFKTLFFLSLFFQVSQDA